MLCNLFTEKLIGLQHAKRINYLNIAGIKQPAKQNPILHTAVQNRVYPLC